MSIIGNAIVIGGGTIPAGYADVTLTTAVEGDVKFPKKFVKADGTLATGMENATETNYFPLTTLANWHEGGGMEGDFYYTESFSVPHVLEVDENYYYRVVFDGVEYICQAHTHALDSSYQVIGSESTVDGMPIFDEYPFCIESYKEWDDYEEDYIDPYLDVYVETGGNHTLSITEIAITPVGPIVSFSTIRTGSDVPSSSLGVNGDIYIQTS